MSSSRDMYRAGLEQHLELLGSNQAIVQVGKLLAGDKFPLAVTGTESLQDATKQLGSGLFAVSKWVGGNTLTVFKSVVSRAGEELIKAFSDNETLIKRITLDFHSSSGETDYSVPKDKLETITINGDVDSIKHDLDVLLDTLTKLTAHNKDVLNYLDKRLLLVGKLKNCKSASEVFSIAEEVKDLAYPIFNLGSRKGGVYSSKVLPGGKVWEFDVSDEKAPKYLISGDKPAGGATSITLSGSEVKDILNRLAKINSMHKDLKQSYDGYLSFIKSWSEMVKRVDESLAKVKWLSRSALSEAEKLLAGENTSLAFYSGFTPRVVGYTDRYIHGVLGVFA